ncbi:hypothetical protein [Dryocola clanedunensis]
MSNLNNERASDADIQQIIDSTEKGTTMFVTSWAFYLMAKELKAARKTLTHLFYTWNGGEQWKPPLGLPPSYISNDRAELEEYRKASKEPIAWLNEDELPENYPYDEMFPFSKVDIVRLFPVYAPQKAPPLQAVTVPDEQTWEELCIENPEMTMGDAIIRAASWNACRSAMLAAAPQPLGK